jgi:glyoxylase-like metal-dependent hydrolase (beta-lactamase superfamily II)
MVLIHDGEFQILKVAGLGPYNNNGYILADPKTLEAYIIDAPKEIDKVLDIAQEFHVKGVLITHSHHDHIAGYTDLKRATDLPIGVHPADQSQLPESPSFLLEHNNTLYIGRNQIRMIHTPGHTPGGICLLIGDCLISGDTLFPGGPGYTRDASSFRQLKMNITTYLLPLPLGVIVLPGHGDNTTIGHSRTEYSVFSSKPHPDDLHGEIQWETT